MTSLEKSCSEITMQVNNVLILAAGKGTRMGKIGEVIPKLLWPVFQSELLKLQIEFAKKLYPEANIFVNTYYYGEKIQAYFDENNFGENVSLVIENEPLDIGGAIHNLAKQLNYSGVLAILNGDQFITMEEKLIESALALLESKSTVLLGYEVNSNDLYNALELDDKQSFKGVIPNKEIERNQKMVTYTGNCFIDLSRLRKSSGLSKFFDTVANPIEDQVAVMVLEKFEYWDFGTLKRYHDSHFQLLSSRDSKFYGFLEEVNAIDPSLIEGDHCYNCSEGINLTGKSNKKAYGPHSIILSEKEVSIERVESKRIVFNSIIEDSFSS